MERNPKRLTNEQFFTRDSDIEIRLDRRDESFPLHWHEFFELMLVTDGSGSNIVNGTVLPMQAGSAFLLTPADFHEIVPEPDSRVTYYNIIFPESAISKELHDALFQHHMSYSVRFDPAEASYVQVLADRLWKEAQQTASTRRIAMRGLLELLLIVLLRQADTAIHRHSSQQPAETLTGLLQSPIRNALVYIHHHYREPLSLADAARHANLSVNYFSEQFSRHTGIPFQLYVQALRLEFARNLLSVSDLSVTEVCHTAGFQTLTHFERTFKKRYGCPPKQFAMKYRICLRHQSQS